MDALRFGAQLKIDRSTLRRSQALRHEGLQRWLDRDVHDLKRMFDVEVAGRFTTPAHLVFKVDTPLVSDQPWATRKDRAEYRRRVDEAGVYADEVAMRFSEGSVTLEERVHFALKDSLGRIRHFVQSQPAIVQYAKPGEAQAPTSLTVLLGKAVTQAEALLADGYSIPTREDYKREYYQKANPLLKVLLYLARQRPRPEQKPPEGP